jgi:DNA polymerase-1
LNFQNIPRDDKTVKRAIVPKRGALFFADFSQIEPRLFGYNVAKGLGDPTIADWYRDGRDLYNEIAGKVFDRDSSEITEDERQQGKVWFLMSLYSAGPKKIALETGMDMSDAKKFYVAFHERFPQIKRLSNPKPVNERAMKFWQPGLIETVYARRGFLKTPWGRHLHAEQWGEFKLLNKLIQGSAADYMKQSLSAVAKWQRFMIETEGLCGRAVSVVHDELIFDVPPDEVPVFAAAVPRLMSHPDAVAEAINEVIPIEISMEVSYTNWADKVALELEVTNG